MKNNKNVVFFILCLWFVISFVTNFTDPLMPFIVDGFNISYTLAGFIPFSFFLAYGLVSIPAGVLIEKIGSKNSMLLAFSVNLSGAMFFVFVPSYFGILFALFCIGMGMAMLQVIINPLMRTAGGEKHFAFFSVMGQFVFGLASFVSPIVFSLFLAEVGKGPASGFANWVTAITPVRFSWVIFYWGFAVIFSVILLILSRMDFPRLEEKEGELSNPVALYKKLIKEPNVLLFFLGIACYVGVEQSIAKWMSEYLSSIHGVSPAKEGAKAVALFWGGMSLGCLLGLVLLKLMDSKLVLRLFTLASMLTLMCAIFGDTQMALIAFPAMGFFISVMFSIIFSLALNSREDHHGAFSGILCSGILGGALLPLIIGITGDVIGLRFALILLYFPLGFILSMSIWAKPLVSNDTFSFKTKSSSSHEK